MHIPNFYTIDMEGEQIVTVNVKRKRMVLAQEGIKKLQFKFTSGPPVIVTPEFSLYRTLFRIPYIINAHYYPQGIEIDEDSMDIDLEVSEDFSQVLNRPLYLEASEDFSQILNKSLKDIDIGIKHGSGYQNVATSPNPKRNVEYVIFNFQDGASLHLSGEAPRTLRYPLTIRTKWVVRGLF